MRIYVSARSKTILYHFLEVFTAVCSKEYILAPLLINVHSHGKEQNGEWHQQNSKTENPGSSSPCSQQKHQFNNSQTIHFVRHPEISWEASAPQASTKPDTSKLTSEFEIPSYRNSHTQQSTVPLHFWYLSQRSKIRILIWALLAQY